MSKILYINFRKKNVDSLERKLLDICKKLEPDNITAHPPKVSVKKSSAYAIINPVNTVRTEKDSVLLGHIFPANKDWADPLGKIPDGSFAIYRSDSQYTEIVNDTVASRSVWYYFDELLFIASSSQRAITLYLENFEFNEKIIPWMLSTGSIGPYLSWDKRIQLLKPDSSLLLDKTLWQLTCKSDPIVFQETEKPFAEHKKILKDAIDYTFDNLNVDLDKWALPLSGGYDSRGILYFLLGSKVNNDALKTITWGLKGARKERGSDAYVAKKVAEKSQVHNKFYISNVSNEPIRKIVGRFIENGEGRIDHISGYMDGFEIWKTIFEDGITGVIRGDECFGFKEATSPLVVRILYHFAQCSDYSNLKDYRKYGIPEQEIPDFMKQSADETLSAWRDRLYYQFRIPTVLSALSELKLGYIEQISPLLAKKILTTVKSQPDRFRTQKVLFKRIISEFRPRMKFANRTSTAPLEKILRREDIVTLFREELDSKYAAIIFNKDFIKKILNSLQKKKENENNKIFIRMLKGYLKNLVPRSIKNRIMVSRKLYVDPNVLAFRVYIIIYMHKLLNSTENAG